MVESWFEVGFGFWKQTLAIEGQVYWIKWVKIQAVWLTPKKVLLCNEAKCEVLKTGSKTNFKRKWPLFKKKKKKRLFSCFEGENIHCEICVYWVKQNLMLLYQKSQLLLPVTSLKIGLLGRYVRYSERACDCYYTYFK